MTDGSPLFRMMMELLELMQIAGSHCTFQPDDVRVTISVADPRQLRSLEMSLKKTQGPYDPQVRDMTDMRVCGIPFKLEHRYVAHRERLHQPWYR